MRLAGSLTLAAVLFTASSASAERPVIETSMEGRDLRVIVHGVTEYCSTNASTDVLRGRETIRIVRGRPSRTSRCFSHDDMTFVVKDVESGTYTVTYEQIPAVAPARPVRLAV